MVVLGIDSFDNGLSMPSGKKIGQRPAVGHMTSGLVEQVDIVLQVAGIQFQIMGVIELQWIDKDADAGLVIFTDRPSNQGQMALMQGAHGWHVANRERVIPLRLAPALSQLVDSTNTGS